ncbi:MAG TPA: SsrA-binding protein SmpB [Acidimicrobiales bacterium]|nr:SsrA-binding protein SmpB [Acidimicrobiales bacterium]
MAAKTAKGQLDPNNRVVAQNRRARHEYEILETVEAGVSLTGSEIKSVREAQVQLRDAYARVDRGEAWLHAMHLAPYGFAVGFGSHDPDRPRKLLLHRREIDHLGRRVQEASLTLIPLSLYLKNGRAKVELGLARGRRTYDKRHAIAARDAGREAAREARAAARHGRGG